MSADRALLGRLVRVLERSSLLQRDDRPPHPAERAMSTFSRWNPPAGFPHEHQRRSLHQRARGECQRAPSGSLLAGAGRGQAVPGTHRLRLPRPVIDDPVARVALERRTWRRFSGRKLPLAALSTLLGLTAGVQKWVNVPVYGKYR